MNFLRPVLKARGGQLSLLFICVRKRRVPTGVNGMLKMSYIERDIFFPSQDTSPEMLGGDNIVDRSK